MADDDIRIDIKSDTSQGEKAAQVLDKVGDAAADLAGKMDRARDANGRFVAGAKDVAAEADRAARALERQAAAATKAFAAYAGGGGGSGGGGGGPSPAPSPSGGIDPKRAAAKARLGLAAANITQDAIQGGPASTINNILGLAGDGGVKQILSESLAAAGGVKVLAGAFGTVATLAGAAFLLIDNGLKSAKLGWGDLGDVVDTISGGAMSQAGKNLADAIGSAVEPLGNLTNQALDYWLGWDDATAKVRDHKDEIERATKALDGYAASMKVLGSFKGESQEKEEDKRARIGKEVAELGGAKGNEGVLDKMVWNRVGSDGANKVTVTRNKLDKDGKETGETEPVEMTKAAVARVKAAAELAKALQGDQAALSKIVGEFKAEGTDVSRIEATMGGRDLGAEAKAKEKADKGKAAEQERADADAGKEMAEAEAEHGKKARKLADPLQDRYDRLAGAGKQVTEGEVTNELKAAGLGAPAAKAMAPDVLASLKAGYEDAVSKKAGETGLGRDDAEKALAEDDAEEDREKAERDRAKGEREAEQPRKDREKAEREAEKARRDAGEKADKATRGTGLDARGQQAMLMSMFKGGSEQEVVGRVSAGLKAELMSKGMGSEEAGLAATGKAEEWAGKLGDELVAKSMEGPEPLRAAERIDVGSFAKSVESAGADTQKEIAGGIDDMKNKLAELVRLTGRGPRLAP